MAPQVFVLDEADTRAAEEVASSLGRHGLNAESHSDLPGLVTRLHDSTTGSCIALLLRRPCTGLSAVRSVLGAPPSVGVVIRALDQDNEADRVLALEAGVDDYVPVGASAREMVARLRAVLRRLPRNHSSAESKPSVHHGGWRLSTESRELYAPDGSPLRLTSAEFDLLYILVRAGNQPVSREVISQGVFRRSFQLDDRGADNLVVRLRRKLGDTKDAPAIKSVRGVGYAFVGFPAPQENLSPPVSANDPDAAAQFALECGKGYSASPNG